MRILKKLILNFLNLHVSSCILRARLFRLFGSTIGDGSKIEQIILLNYDGSNLGNLILGEKVYIGAGTILDLKNKIKIGDSTKIAAGCNLSTHVDCGKENDISYLYPKREEMITIGSNSWIGLSVTILCGISIGSGVIIGANSLVNKNIPSRVLAHGIPIKIVKQL
jgi:acetyltransferase-like isoleucine patch superfamily enzyme